MPWQIQFHEEPRIVETRYTGRLTAEDLQAAVRQTLMTAQEHEAALFLGDCSRLTGGHSVIDLYAMVDVLEFSGFSHACREAVVLPGLAAPAKDVEFWETACRNRGINVRVFDTRELALDWLLGKK